MRLRWLLFTVFAGCAFPDPELRDLDATADAADAATDAVDAANDAPADASGAEVAEGGACETGNNCDCDGDGDNKPGPGCLGGDCDDGDGRRSSKVTAHQSYPVTGVPHGGDWNCVNGVEREYNDGVNCGGLAVGPCAGAQGYKEKAPTCGGPATLVKCKVSGAVLCVEDTSTTVTVLCK